MCNKDGIRLYAFFATIPSKNLDTEHYLTKNSQAFAIFVRCTKNTPQCRLPYAKISSKYVSKSLCLELEDSIGEIRHSFLVGMSRKKGGVAEMRNVP